MAVRLSGADERASSGPLSALQYDSNIMNDKRHVMITTTAGPAYERAAFVGMPSTAPTDGWGVQAENGSRDGKEPHNSCAVIVTILGKQGSKQASDGEIRDEIYLGKAMNLPGFLRGHHRQDGAGTWTASHPPHTPSRLVKAMGGDGWRDPGEEPWGRLDSHQERRSANVYIPRWEERIMLILRYPGVSTWDTFNKFKTYFLCLWLINISRQGQGGLTTNA